MLSSRPPMTSPMNPDNPTTEMPLCDFLLPPPLLPIVPPWDGDAGTQCDRGSKCQHSSVVGRRITKSISLAGDLDSPPRDSSTGISLPSLSTSTSTSTDFSIDAASSPFPPRTFASPTPAVVAASLRGPAVPSAASLSALEPDKATSSYFPAAKAVILLSRFRWVTFRTMAVSGSVLPQTQA